MSEIFLMYEIFLTSIEQTIETAPDDVTGSDAGATVQTLPLWIFSNLARPNQAPVVNVVAALLIVLSVLPVWLAQRLSADAFGGRL